MNIETDTAGGRTIGSRIRMTGRFLGLRLYLDETVTQREPPWRKAWQTAEVRLLVIGHYRLGFELNAGGIGTIARIFIDYQLPEHWPARGLGYLLAGVYARWCVSRMAADAVSQLGGRVA